MKKKLILLITLLLTIVLTSCSSKSMFTFNLDESYDGYIVLGTSADYPPYESLKTVNDKLTVVGIDIELAKEIAHALGKNLKVVNRDFDFLLEDLKDEKIDFVISGMNPTPERSQIVDFSNIYYEATHSVLINKNNLVKYETKELLNDPNIKIGAQLGSVQQEIIMDEFSNSQSVFLNNVNDLIMQLNDNKLEAVILETPVATSYITRYPNLTLTNYNVGNPEDGTAVAVSKGNTELLTVINNVIDELTNSGKMTQIINDAILDDSFIEPESLFSKSNVILLLQGVLMTIVLALLSVFFGSILGLFITILRLNNNKLLKLIAKWYVEIVRGTPLLVQVLLIYSFFNIPVILFLGIDLSSFIPGVLALLINSSAYVSEIFRGGIESVDSGQTEAGLALGMSNKSVMRKIVLPQAIKNVIPSLGNEFITMIKETSIFMYLGVAELMYNASIIKSQSFQIKEVYIITALTYLVLTLSTSKLLSLYQKKLGEKDAK